MWPWTAQPKYSGDKQQKKWEIENIAAVVSDNTDHIVWKSPVSNADIIKLYFLYYFLPGGSAGPNVLFYLFRTAWKNADC